ncbi:sensor histidine kinase [Piscinibacter sp. XHJ-5]|uniref:sensor histidine kinase n=1 Tax=Piscinibacter sp. XHJ-5 TaxID=3037797 RepID=UPI0024533BB8|nr:sensor histidine kinase [Piscinibacter sp. XHJ-5]
MLIARDRVRARPSLRSRLARHVLAPLALTWGLGSIVVLAVGNHFAAQAFDRALLDDAYALAAYVRHDGQRLALELTPPQISTLLFDHSESVYFAVFGPGGTQLAGDSRLSPARIPAGAAHEFAELAFAGQRVRSVSLRRDEPAEFVVVMAQTTAGRTQLLQRLLAVSALVQVVLLGLLAWWLSRTIERDLRPLTDLQHAVDRRDAGDLAPLPASLTDDATTRDMQRLGQAVNSLLSRLQESLKAQREFAGSVAHELRTPLAGIRAQAGYALAQDDAASWRSELQGIAQAEQRASRLVDQLLALARADEASAGLTLETLALDELVRDILMRFMPRADAAGVDLGAEGLDEPVEVRGDKALIEGMLNNLLDNALRYGSAGTPRVTVAVHREHGAAVLSVTDNGPGLGAADMETLTQRWAQGAQGRTLGQGAGLGLAIVRRYAELLGAQLRLGSGPQGEGLCASVRFEHTRHPRSTT